MTSIAAFTYLDSLYENGIPIRTMWIDQDITINLTRLNFEEMFQAARSLIGMNYDAQIVLAEWH